MNDYNITSAQYGAVDVVITCIITVINGLDCVVPLATDNTDYQAIMEWASQDGNIIQDAD